MVLYKRKPVQYLPRPVIEDESSEVWVIPETNEVFTSYEPYLQRMDFYKSRRFICEITGHSGMTFFEALRSELEESREVNNSFPEALKEPILRRIQFSTTSRVDNLVDEIYEEFKSDFYPGEPVLILLEDNSRIHGTIRDKANFPEQLYADGTIKTPAYARYLVKISDRPNEEALLDQDHITRDRKSFTKLMLRGFIKNNVTRESWTGAPWLVKASVAEEYKISTEVPKHLQYGAKVAEKKAMKKADQDGFFGFFSSQQLPELKPAVKGQKSKPSAHDHAKTREAQYLEYQRSLNGNPTFLPPGNPLRPTKPPLVGYKKAPHPAVIVKEESRPPTPPPIKYPIEDLEIAPNKDKNHRPTLKFLMVGDTDDDGSEDLLPDDVEPESVGLLLETWNTLNVYCEVYQLDSFTFDDFVQAMRFSSEVTDCELFVEIHCALLKTLVDSESHGGAARISLPEIPSETSDDSEGSDEGENEESADEEEQEDPAPARRMTTRSSLAKQEAQELKAQQMEEPEGNERIHRADEMFDEYSWIDRLRRRDFRDGGWEMVMIGLLNQLSVRPRLQQTCNEVLKHLAPIDEPPTQQTARDQYRTLDINLRVKALEIICMLSLETKAIRNYMEECNLQMTESRKVRIEHQKARKAAVHDLRQLHQERKALQPEQEKTAEKSPTPVPEIDGLDDSRMTGLDGDSEMPVDTDDEDMHLTRSLRGGADRAAERKRKQEEERERKEQLAKQPKGSKQYQRVLKKIEDQKAKIRKIEEKIESVESDLREADCPRTKCLGLDRFCNRYWWFERNAMPVSGMPDSSTADAGYANGRLWVQGPDEMERAGFIELTDEQRKQYQKQFHTTPAERKKHEEGPTHVSSAREWGYYDDPETVEQLIQWMDTRGHRESKLVKELRLQQHAITKSMEKRRTYLTLSAQRAESEELPTKRVTTRQKTYVDVNEHRLRCLRWHNGTSLSENGHLHVDPERPAKRQKRNVDDTRGGRGTRGKTLNRRGSRRGN
ncbi:hypothetical protein PDE_07809 [Penicillium oxalicum 114-2]|uniref:DDT domain-containing protein n=1 Tax=Penicillium oxalicum (strain 114-2 / CGMCC 5302) TaxID=933388 RepID=S8B218_PENO1|nr:hypothetical protein PDE_07809 [Penicillium oxalicum 114-2]